MGVYEFCDPDTGAALYHVVPNPHSEKSESTFASESESSTSSCTIHSDDLPGFFIQHYGRQQPASENLARWFPADNVRRFILRYLGGRWLFGGNYVGPVREMLGPVPGRDRRVLEIGTRAGTWVQDMATEFPHVRFQTIDVSPIIAHAPRPNVVFEVYDLSEGLMVEDNSQDAVFLNNVIELVKDYPALLREVHRVLRPGGLIHIHDFSPGLWDPDDISTPAQRTNPAGCHLFELTRVQLARMGIDPDTCDKLPELLQPGSVLWQKPSGVGFQNINSVTRTYPAYPHDGFPCEHKLDASIAPYLAHLSVVATQDMFSIIRDGGMSADDAGMLIERAIEEMKQPARCALLKLSCVYAIKCMDL